MKRCRFQSTPQSTTSLQRSGGQGRLPNQGLIPTCQPFSAMPYYIRIRSPNVTTVSLEAMLSRVVRHKQNSLEASNDNNNFHCKILFCRPVINWGLTFGAAKIVARFLSKNKGDWCCRDNHRNVYASARIVDCLGAQYLGMGYTCDYHNLWMGNDNKEHNLCVRARQSRGNNTRGPQRAPKVCLGRCANDSPGYSFGLAFVFSCAMKGNQA